VSDDGVGGAQPQEGTGLTGLRDRVEALGGSIEVTSPVGHGTVLEVPFPPTGRTGQRRRAPRRRPELALVEELSVTIQLPGARRSGASVDNVLAVIIVRTVNRLHPEHRSAGCRWQDVAARSSSTRPPMALSANPSARGTRCTGLSNGG
jgi:hypothetical protein